MIIEMRLSSVTNRADKVVICAFTLPLPGGETKACNM